MGRILLRSVRRAARVSVSRAARGTGYNEMITIKRTAVIIFMIFFIFISAFDCRYFSYADTNWENIRQQSDLADGFRYYCKSRDLTIDGSAADVVTTFTTQTFNNLCNGLGIDITQLQAEIKAEYDNSGKPIKFLFTSTGIAAYNRIFAQFLQDNNLEVGDSADETNNTVYNGEYFVDDNGNSCLVSIGVLDSYGRITSCTQKGTPFIKDNFKDDYLLTIPNDSQYHDYFSFTYRNTTYMYRVKNSRWNAVYQFVSSNARWYYGWYNFENNEWGAYYNKYATIWKVNGNAYYYGVVGDQNGVEGQIQNGSGNVAIVFLNTNNTVINNNNYEGDTIINNYGVPSDPNEPDEPEPINPLPPDNPYDDPDPIPTTPDGDDWDIDMPDLDINWILLGKEKKFPFDIPFNVMFALSLLNAEPEAPHIEGTLDFGFTEWDYELDLSDFDDVAEICRNFEFLAFLIGLMLMTKKLIWG